MRRDDATFFDHVAKQASDLTHPSQVREFWAIIRRSLPKMRVRQQDVPPMQLEHLEEQCTLIFKVWKLAAPSHLASLWMNVLNTR